MEQARTPQSLTVDYRPAEEPLSRLPVEVPTDSGQATDEDLRSLLHRRLRFLCLLLALLLGAAQVLNWASGIQGSRVTWRGWVGFCICSLVYLLAVLVWARRQVSLTQ